MTYFKSATWIMRTICCFLLVSSAWSHSSLHQNRSLSLGGQGATRGRRHGQVTTRLAGNISPVVELDAELNHTYHRHVNASNNVIFVFRVVDMPSDSALRVSVASENATVDLPLLFTVRQQRKILAWRVPFSLQRGNQRHSYKEVTKTLCPVEDFIHAGEADAVTLGRRRRRRRPVQTGDTVFLEVATDSEPNVDFRLVLRQERVTISMDNSIEFRATPSAPWVAWFTLPEGVSRALVRTTSPDDICATISIQNISCPMFNTRWNEVFGKQYQTMTRQAGITVTRENFPNGMLIVLLVHGDDTECSRSYGAAEQGAAEQGAAEPIFGAGYRQKTVRLEIQEKVSQVAGPMVGAFLLYVLFGIAMIIITVKCISRPDEGKRHQNQQGRDGTLHLDANHEVNQAERNPSVERTTKKYQPFTYNLSTIAIFYVVPVVQLVYIYLKEFNMTGDQDICYYNFLCAYRWVGFSDFNHVYSNIGYVLLGLTFTGIVWWKDRTLQRHASANRQDRQYYLSDLEPCARQNCDNTRRFGLFYAMGAALTAEGILSACYHVCPGPSNFQFDTAFMYVIAVLCMLKIYEMSQPDVLASAHGTFLLLSFAMVECVIGVLWPSWIWWAFFGVLDFGAVLKLGHHVYKRRDFGDRSNTDRQTAASTSEEASVPQTSQASGSAGGGWSIFSPPTHPRRRAFLVTAGLSWAALVVLFILCGTVLTPNDLASGLLFIFIASLLFCTGYIFFWKAGRFYRRRVFYQPFLYIGAVSIFFWMPALYFFSQDSTNWQLSPAVARTKNQDCGLLNFYDNHDIWHFLSAFSLFLTFMILLTLDDQSEFTSWVRKPVSSRPPVTVTQPRNSADGDGGEAEPLHEDLQLNSIPRPGAAAQLEQRL